MGKKQIQKVIKKSFLRINLILLCIILIFSSLLTFHVTRKVHLEDHPKNIILLIGDGMGSNHIEIAKRKYNLEQLNMELLPEQGKVTTFSKSFKATDSAAAASAMATGYKVFNKVVSINSDKSFNETLIELAIEHGMKTGIITSSFLYDATPAAFSSHTSSRKNYSDIIEQQLNSEINIMIGEGKEEYDKYINLMNNNILYIDCIKEAPMELSKRMICTFDKISSNNELDYSLLSCSKYALEVLGKEEEGFFLIIEGGKIDWESHNNNIDGMINELIAFDEVIEFCLNYAKSDKNTCVLVTADHETGGLLLPGKGEPISNDLFTTSNHTGKLVNYYFYPKNVIDIPNIIDNTYIYRLIYNIISNR